MSLTKTISALLTTIGIAVPSALTTWVLTKPKPLKEIDEVIKLDEYIEEINEPEITPQKAPTSPSSIPAQRPQRPFPEGSRVTDSTDMQDDSLEPPEASGGEESQDSLPPSPSIDIPELPAPQDPPETPPVQDEEEEKEKPEDQEPPKPDEKEAEDEKEPEDKDIKESISEAIRIIIQKYNDGYRVETGGIYDSFEIKKHLEYLVTSIKFLKSKEEQQKESQEDNAQ